MIENARTAFEKAGVALIEAPVRGGTDGCTLSFMGLPCPNLCTGGANFHSRFEYASVDSMDKITDLLVKIATDVAKAEKKTVKV